MKKGFLDELKKDFEVIQSDCAYEDYSGCIILHNETLAFSTDLNIDEDFLKGVCEIIDFYYVLFQLGICNTDHTDNYNDLFIKPEGARMLYISREYLQDFYMHLNNHKLLKTLQIKIKALNSSGKKIIFQSRVDWQIKKDEFDTERTYCRRRLGIMICDENIRHKKREDLCQTASKKT